MLQALCQDADCTYCFHSPDLNGVIPGSAWVFPFASPSRLAATVPSPPTATLPSWHSGERGTRVVLTSARE
jgi:hypothetical protein